MAKAFTVASWNVEHFKNIDSRVDRVVTFLKAQDPDVFALYEVEGAEVFTELTTRMPGYSFHITEGPQTQEILVAARKPLTSFFTQKLEFRAGNQFLRPGALLTVTVSNKSYSLLFLHTKSSNLPVGLGLRDDMFAKAVKFKKTLDKAIEKQTGIATPANYLFLGDLNTMGMKYAFDGSIDARTELRKLDADARKKSMRRLRKTHPATWSNGSGSSIPDSDLDHVVIASHVKLKSFGTDANGDPIEVSVRGWVNKTTAASKDKFIREHSDHSLLFFQVEK